MLEVRALQLTGNNTPIVFESLEGNVEYNSLYISDSKEKKLVGNSVTRLGRISYLCIYSKL